MGQTSTSASSVHLDAFRACAAVVVFLAHARNIFFGNLQTASSIPAAQAGAPVRTAASAPAVPAALGIGHDAVMVFFVLSGYLVGWSVLKSMREQRWSWRKYLTQRLTRLWIVLLPAILIGFCIDVIGTHWFGPASLYGAPAGQSVIQQAVAERLSAATVAQNVVFLQTITTHELGSNVALWSLANEFWYYILFPLLVIALWSSVRVSFRLFSLAGAVGLLWFVGPSISLYFSIWLLGVGIGYLPGTTAGAGRLLGAVSAPLFIAACAYFRRHPAGSQFESDFVLAAIFGCLLYAALQQTQPIRQGVYSQLSRLVAGGSYTLYLVHLPALVFLNAAMEGAWRPWPKDVSHSTVFAAVLAGVLLYAFAIYFVFERNTDRVRKALAPRRQPAAAPQEAIA